MNDLYEYLIAASYKVTMNKNATISINRINANEIINLIKGINFNDHIQVEAVVIESLTYEIRLK